MNVKILNLLLMTLGILAFSGCAEKIVYKDVPYEVKIPVKCKPPDVHCDFNKETDTEVIISLRTCIEDLRKSIEVCK